MGQRAIKMVQTNVSLVSWHSVCLHFVDIVSVPQCDSSRHMPPGYTEPSKSTQRTAMRSDTACSCDLSWYILVMAWRLRTSALAITLTDSWVAQASGRAQHILQPWIEVRAGPNSGVQTAMQR